MSRAVLPRPEGTYSNGHWYLVVFNTNLHLHCLICGLVTHQTSIHEIISARMCVVNNCMNPVSDDLATVLSVHMMKFPQPPENGQYSWNTTIQKQPNNLSDLLIKHYAAEEVKKLANLSCPTTTSYRKKP